MQLSVYVVMGIAAAMVLGSFLVRRSLKRRKPVLPVYDLRQKRNEIRRLFLENVVVENTVMWGNELRDGKELMLVLAVIKDGGNGGQYSPPNDPFIYPREPFIRILLCGNTVDGPYGPCIDVRYGMERTGSVYSCKFPAGLIISEISDRLTSSAHTLRC